MFGDLNRFVNSAFVNEIPDEDRHGRFWTPAVDVVESEDSYVLEAELSGLTKDDVKISVENSILTIQGEKKNEKEEKPKNIQRRERVYGSFLRSFTLPTHVKTDKIEAEFKDGLLRIILPKVEEVKSRTIEVKVK